MAAPQGNTHYKRIDSNGGREVGGLIKPHGQRAIYAPDLTLLPLPLQYPSTPAKSPQEVWEIL